MIVFIFALTHLTSPCGSRGCFRIGPIRFLAGWHKRRPEPGLELVSLGLVV